MNWSGTTPIPDGDQVDRLSDDLRAKLYANDPRRTDLDDTGTWIVWVAAAICLLVPIITWAWVLIDQ